MEPEVAFLLGCLATSTVILVKVLWDSWWKMEKERHDKYEVDLAAWKKSRVDFWNQLAPYGDGSTGPQCEACGR